MILKVGGVYPSWCFRSRRNCLNFFLLFICDVCGATHYSQSWTDCRLCKMLLLSFDQISLKLNLIYEMKYAYATKIYVMLLSFFNIVLWILYHLNPVICSTLAQITRLAQHSRYRESLSLSPHQLSHNQTKHFCFWI